MTPVADRVGLVVGVVLVALAIATSLALGTLGWVVVGMGVMTDCTTDYSCSASGCAPCAATSRWITVGGLAQLALAVAGVVVLVRAIATTRERRRAAVLPLAGALLLATSLATVAVTTVAAQASYCREGTPGYEDSYCSTDD